MAQEDPPSLAWHKLKNPKSAREFLAVKNPDKLAEKVITLFKMDPASIGTSLRDAAVLDYYVTVIWFAQEHRFEEQETSAFLQLAENLFENCTKTEMSLAENVTTLRDVMLTHGPDRPDAYPDGNVIPDFNSIQRGKLVIDFFMTGLFQHYCLWQDMFSVDQDPAVVISTLQVCSPPPCPPLDEAVTEAHWQLYLDPNQPPQAEEASEEADEIEISAVAPPKNLTAEQVKTIASAVIAKEIEKLETDVRNKLKDRETKIGSRLNSLEASSNEFKVQELASV
eukprot:UC4_evm1s373